MRWRVISVFKENGWGGYDKTETPLTKALTEEGISVSYVDDPKAIPKDVQLIVFTPAIPKDHLGLELLPGPWL
ncbi:MAG: hypothetical protein WDM78_23380 [Puia sp.]